MLDLLISFDDTGSMSSVRKEVRSKINDLVNNLFTNISGLRIGVIIHNDYCDGPKELLRKLDFTSDKNAIYNFVNQSTCQGGGDYEEAYAYVLNSMKSFSWEAEKRVGILIGDATPHEKGHRSGGVVEAYDWRQECTELSSLNGVQVYTIQALGNRNAVHFYESVANITNGIKLDLSQFSHINDYLMAISYKQIGQEALETFEKSEARFTQNLMLKNMFNKLKGVVNTELTSKIENTGDLLSKFQVVNVPHSQKIKDFVENMGLHYRAGRGFYQLINSELVQANKEVIFVDKTTGETFFDTKWCREQLGLPYGVKGKVNPHRLACASKYDIYIQSNSYTRNLDPGTKFLYELEKK